MNSDSISTRYQKPAERAIKSHQRNSWKFLQLLTPEFFLMNSTVNPDSPLYDVVVVGGSLSGAATATLLLRQNPELKLLLVEKSTHFTRRVGEATVEVSAVFSRTDPGVDSASQ